MKVAQNAKELWQWLRTRALTVSVTAIVVSIVSATFSYQSVKEAKRSADIAEKSLKISQRAYLSLADIRLVTLEVGNPLEVETRLRNTGSTPAEQVSGLFSVRYESPTMPLDEVWNFDADCCVGEETRSSGVVPPNVYMRHRSTMRWSLSEAQFEAIQKGDVLVYMIGEVEYFDVFNDLHRTRFCGVYSSGRKVFDTCAEYNEIE